jgi:aspartyl protease family protein
MTKKFAILAIVTLLLVACGQKTPSAFKNITLVEAISDKEGFLPVKVFFPKNEQAFARYVRRDSTLMPVISLKYTRKQKDDSNNSVIYFFEDKEWGCTYQFRLKNEKVIKMRIITDKNNVPYSITRCEKREIIHLEQDGNMRYITVEVNGMKLKFLLDTGASCITISLAEATVLSKQGLIKEEDILEKTEEYELADGRLIEGSVVNLRTVKIGSKTLKNVKATIIDNPYAELLLGQSILSQFGKYTIDNKNNELILE